MAKIPLPERGQPLDVTYISQMAQAINELSTAISPATYKYTSIDTPNAGRQNIKGSEARVIAGNVRVVNSGTITAGEEKSFTYSFLENLSTHQLQQPLHITLATQLLVKM